MDVKRVADHYGTAFVSTQHASGEAPRHLQLADVFRVYLGQGAIAGGREVAVLHHPFSGIILPNQKLFVRLNHAGEDQKHRGHKPRSHV